MCAGACIYRYNKRWLAMVKQPSRFGRAVALSTCPADAFGQFTPPELVMVAGK